MIKVCKVCAYVTGVAILFVVLMSINPVKEQGFTPRPIVPPNPVAEEDLRPHQDRNNPVIPKLPSFRGDIFDGFVELRMQDIDVGPLGIISFKGEPFETLVNIHYITMVHRYEDFKETDYSCMLYFKDKELPFLVRQEYKEVLSSIRRASGK